MKYLFVLFIAFFVACSHKSKIWVVNYGEAIERTATQKVLVFKDKASVGRKFKEIARLNMIGNRNRERSVGMLVEKAKELGADGIILEDTQITTSSGLVSSASFHEAASAIVFE